jgi:hypothetical protein
MKIALKFAFVLMVAVAILLVPRKASAVNSCGEADGICLGECASAMGECVDVCNETPPWYGGDAPFGFSTPAQYGACINACEATINSCNAECQAEYCPCSGNNCNP